MKSLRTITSAIFIMLTLTSGSSFMISIHFCNGMAKNFRLFGKVDSCPNEKKLPPCHRQLTAPCCEDETIVHYSQDFKNPTVEINITSPTGFDFQHNAPLLSEIIPSQPYTLHYFDYQPPNNGPDLTVVLHSFLI